MNIPDERRSHDSPEGEPGRPRHVVHGSAGAGNPLREATMHARPVPQLLTQTIAFAVIGDTVAFAID